MQHFLRAVKIENFQLKIIRHFLIFTQNIDFGYMLEQPRQGSNEYPQSMYWKKNIKGGNEYSNIRISNEYSNAFPNPNIHIFSRSYFSFYFLSSFCLKFVFILAAPFSLNAVFRESRYVSSLQIALSVWHFVVLTIILIS